MAEIIGVVIKGSSGFCSIDDAYEDKITLTRQFISYKFKPEIESEANPSIKWNYKTNSSSFKIVFDEISKMIHNYIGENFYESYTCIGGIEFNVTYSDKTKMKKIYFLPGDSFKELFISIRKLIPTCEKIPQVLLISEDYLYKNE
jgi:hypothetical protein